LRFTRSMAGLDEVMARVANDPLFADAVRTDPTNALRGYQLDPSELARLERAVGAAPAGSPTLFASSGAASTATVGGIGAAKVAMVAAGLGLLGGGAGLALGAAGVFGGGDSGGGTTETASLRPDAAAFYDCSSADASGATLGDLHRGDTVWVIGQTGDGWLVIRNPHDLTTPAWMRAGDLELGGDTSGLPELACDQAIEEASAPLPPSTTTGTASTVPGDTTTTTVPGPTTTVVAPTTAPSTNPATPPRTRPPRRPTPPDPPSACRATRRSCTPKVVRPAPATCSR